MVKKKKKIEKIGWLDKPEIHNYPAAYSYLNLLFEDDIVKEVVDKLKKSNVN